MAMKVTWRRVLFLVLAVAVAVLYFGWDTFFADRNRIERLSNQVWIDHAPRNERDVVRHLVLLERANRRLGVAGQASRFRLQQDMLVWNVEGNNLRVLLLQDQQRVTVQARTWTCVGEAPKPFELCLELKRGDRAVRYYSKREWVVRPRGDGVAADVSWLEPAWDVALGVPAGVSYTDGPEAQGWGALAAP
jgi:hypothetical protein